VTLIATRLPSVSVTLPGGAAAKLGDVPIPVATSWSADPAEPVAVSLVAFVEAPGSAGASRSSVRLFTPPIPALEAGSGRGDGIQVRIDLIDRPDLIAGTYPRTLNLVAITQ
jgi:hypothetical protein